MNKIIICIVTAIVINQANTQANMLVNCDFELGNTGFSSFYRYNPYGSRPGSQGGYFIGDNSKAWNGNFPQALFDHTSGSGLMLLGDGSGNRSIVWQQEVAVVAGAEYEFSGWVASLYHISLPRMEFLINGQSVGNILSAALSWRQFSATWTASDTGPAVLAIRAMTTGSMGNDFAIDDLSFTSTQALLPPVIDIITPLNEDGCVEATVPEGAVIEALVGEIIDDEAIVYYWSTSDGTVTNGTSFEFELGLNESTVVFLMVEDTVTGETASSFEQVRVSDTTSPDIEIISPEHGDLFTGNNLKLKVRVTDTVDLNITEYKVNMGSTMFYPLDPQSGISQVKLSKPTSDTAPVPMEITVSAEDASGNISSSSVQVMKQHDNRKK